ncbi:WD40-repeat-containing domain protein [Dipodascopsis uninucleata]
MAKRKREIADNETVDSLSKEQKTRPKSEMSAILRVITGSYEHHLLCVSLTTDLTAFSTKQVDDEKTTAIFTPIFHFSPHTASIRCMAHSKRYLVTGGNDEHIRLYDLQKRKEIGTLMYHDGSVTCLEFVHAISTSDEENGNKGASGGKWLLSGGEDGKVLLWRTKDWQVIVDMKGHKSAVNDMSVHPSGKIALTVSRDRTLKLWNLMTGKNASTMKLSGNGEPTQVCWNGKGNMYAIGYQRKVIIYDMNSKPLVSIDLTSALYRLRYVTVKELDNDSKSIATKEYLVLSDSSGSIAFRDVEILSDKLPVTFELQGHKTRVKDFNFFSRAPPISFLQSLSEDEQQQKLVPITFMTSISSDGKILIWNLNVRQCIAVYETSERLNCATIVPEEVEKYDTVKQAARAEDSDSNDSDEEVNEE